MRVKSEKGKPIDLGKLQDQFEATGRELKAATKALERAQSDWDARAAAHAAALCALKQASRAVLS